MQIFLLKIWIAALQKIEEDSKIIRIVLTRVRAFTNFERPEILRTELWKNIQMLTNLLDVLQIFLLFICL